MRRIAAAALNVLLALGAFAPSALAAPPTRVDDEMTREDLCDFPVSIVSRGNAKTIELPGDRFIFTSPGLRITVTNLEDTRQQVTLVATGAFHDTVLENGDVLTVSTGRSVLINIVPGVNLAFVTGRFTFGFDADGNPIQPFEGNGQVIDICALLE